MPENTKNRKNQGQQQKPAQKKPQGQPMADQDAEREKMSQRQGNDQEPVQGEIDRGVAEDIEGKQPDEDQDEDEDKVTQRNPAQGREDEPK